MIECICINDAAKPEEIPMSSWVKKGNKYHVLMIKNMVNQGAILGVVLSEIALEKLNTPYSCFKIDRFGFQQKDLEALLALMADCAELSDFNLDELMKEQVPVREKVPLELEEVE